MQVEINIPDGLHDITLAQYQRFVRIEGDEEFLNHKKLEIFANMDLQYAKQMKAADVSRIVSKINEALMQSVDFQPTFVMNDVEYGFIPNLDGILFGELSDIEENITDWQKMHIVMAVLFRPVVQKIKDRYRIEDYNGTTITEELMKAMPMSIVQGAMVFFWRLGIDLSATIIQSSEQELNSIIATKGSSQRSGDGTPSITPLLMAMRSNLTQLRNSTPSLL
jgi:hypothetical protein